ncbi:MAG: Cold-shock DNA-binding domain [Thermomicrobiales bacterium]|jgi:cold shock CspA family protein|nr:Cold-shock DNA-binding domain [Thermomicrobiales bacterium]
MTGTITDLRPGGFGFIASDSRGRPWALPFRRAAVAADGFDRLRVGHRVRFDQEATPGDPSRRHAVGVAPLD